MSSSLTRLLLIGAQMHPPAAVSQTFAIQLFTCFNRRNLHGMNGCAAEITNDDDVADLTVREIRDLFACCGNKFLRILVRNKNWPQAKCVPVAIPPGDSLVGDSLAVISSRDFASRLPEDDCAAVRQLDNFIRARRADIVWIRCSLAVLNNFEVLEGNSGRVGAGVAPRPSHRSVLARLRHTARQGYGLTAHGDTHADGHGNRRTFSNRLNRSHGYWPRRFRRASHFRHRRITS